MTIHSEKTSESFERYKIKIELFKWFMVSVVLVLVTTIINWGFNDRETGMKEISQYYEYATDLIISNDNPVKKRMLAQFFASVTPSEKLKKGWQDYYKEVNKEYEAFMEETKINQLRLDSLNKIEAVKLSAKQKNEIKELRSKVKEHENIMNAPIMLPNGKKFRRATELEIKELEYSTPDSTAVN